MKKVCWIVIFLLVSLSVGGTVSAAVFVRGKVTRSPWKNGKTFIAVDHVEYTVMPQAKVMLQQHRVSVTAAENSRGQLQRLRPGTTVWISVEGNRIYQIWEVK